VNGFHVCSFSSPAAELPKKRRTSADVLAALKLNPRISTWDMSERKWLRSAIEDLECRGLIEEQREEPYPWHRWKVKASAEHKEGEPPHPKVPPRGHEQGGGTCL
jgi:hypothetical protein